MANAIPMVELWRGGLLEASSTPPQSGGCGLWIRNEALRRGMRGDDNEEDGGDWVNKDLRLLHRSSDVDSAE